MSSDQTGFQQLRTHFHDLVECDEGERRRRLDLLGVTDPALAESLAGLLAHADPGDLAPPVSWLPEQLGPFRIGDLLGRGGMGEVRVGERVSGGFSQRVALKLLKPLVHAPSLHQRFLRERQVLARLEHPHIARLIDGGVHAQTLPWLAMELVEGQDLGVWQRQSNPTLQQRIQLLIKVCDAVAFAHRQLVVHRDLKPSNIRVGAGDEPKLLDFGLAKLLDDPGSDAWSRYGLAMTQRYAAPEQMLGERAGTASDIHALGVLGFELVSGRLPFADNGEAEPVWSTRILSPERIDLRESLSSDSGLDSAGQTAARRFLPDIFAKAMARDAEARHASASALADDLRDWLAGLPPRSGIGSKRERLLAFGKRHRLALTVATMALLGILVSLAFALQQTRLARLEAERADQQTRALLEVLAAASPEHFSGRDPTASEFLVDAARRIHADESQDHIAASRALTQIGVGLINLDKPEAASVVLEQAWARMDQSAETRVDARLDLIKLQALVVDTDSPQVRTELDRLAQRLRLWMGRQPNPDLSISAQAALGGAYAITGHAAEAELWFECCGKDLVSRVPALASTTIESAFRQKGRGQLFLGNLDAGADSLQASLEAIEREPQAFSAMRRAEAHWWLAEAQMDLDRFDEAAKHLALAESTVNDEYRLDHEEGRRFHLHQALLAAWLGNLRRAVAMRPTVTSAGKQTSLMFDLVRLDVVTRAQSGDCDDAREARQRLMAESSRQHKQLAQLDRLLTSRCRQQD